MRVLVLIIFLICVIGTVFLCFCAIDIFWAMIDSIEPETDHNHVFDWSKRKKRRRRMKQFKCKHCGKTRDVSFWKEVNSFHLFGKWVYVKCPHCGKRSWMKRVEEEK